MKFNAERRPCGTKFGIVTLDCIRVCFSPDGQRDHLAWGKENWSQRCAFVCLFCNHCFMLICAK